MDEVRTYDQYMLGFSNQGPIPGGGTGDRPI